MEMRTFVRFIGAGFAVIVLNACESQSSIVLRPEPIKSSEVEHPVLPIAAPGQATTADFSVKYKVGEPIVGSSSSAGGYRAQVGIEYAQ